MSEEKKLFKSLGLNVDFKDLGNGIYKGSIEFKTFELKDVLKEKGYTFESKRTSEVRNNQPVTVFTQKKEIHVVNDLDGLKKQILGEIAEVLQLFAKTVAIASAIPENVRTTKQTTT